jgi:hypothetical protein
MENLTASYMSGVKSGMVGHTESDATGEKDFNSAAGPVKILHMHERGSVARRNMSQWTGVGR